MLRSRTSDNLDALLPQVSRSFYLSIRLLPARLRRPVGCAYLLARATDTVADTASVSILDRQAMLSSLNTAITQAAPGPELGALAAAFASRQDDLHESELIRRVDEAVISLQALAPDDRTKVQTVLHHIVRGQALDLARFPAPGTPRALPDAASLHEYTYLVAGCVGEFWTQLCLQHLDGYARLPPAQMLALGRSFGCGLQLVNIVRDVGADLRAGRCYFPADELAQAGLQPASILADPACFLPVWRRWQDAAAARMQHGLDYALAVQPRRPRAAAALPALLGVRTLALLRAAGIRGLEQRIKMPRREVHGLLVRTVLTLAARGTLRHQYQQMRCAAPAAGWDNPAQ